MGWAQNGSIGCEGSLWASLYTLRNPLVLRSVVPRGLQSLGGQSTRKTWLYRAARVLCSVTPMASVLGRFVLGSLHQRLLLSYQRRAAMRVPGMEPLLRPLNVPNPITQDTPPEDAILPST